MFKITLNKLKEIEKEEYEKLQILNKFESECREDGDVLRADEIKRNISYQMGRWGIIDELIEELMKVEK